MKTKSFFAVGFSLLCLNFSVLQAREYNNPHERKTGDSLTPKSQVNSEHYREMVRPTHESKDLQEGEKDSHVKIKGWYPDVPVARILNALQEGATSQLEVLKLFSAPNVITRSPDEKELWVYYWTASYYDEQDLSKTVISMDYPGKRVKKNKKPVVFKITFNDQNVVESYNIDLWKIKRDAFYDPR